MGIFSPSLATPTVTEKTLNDQTGKVFIVTGATSGIGKELAYILYAHNAKVYLAVRSEEKALTVIQYLKTTYPESKGEAIFLSLDLSDLTTIKSSAQAFLDQETRLDVLWNNAGVMVPPAGSKSKQGYELQLGVNCLGHHLFTEFLVPRMAETAQTASPGSVRIVWVSSSASKVLSPSGGVVMDNLDYRNDKTKFHKYGVSKAGNVLYAREFGKRHPESGVVAVSCDPGNLKTELYRNVQWYAKWFVNMVLYPPIYGAYSMLYAGFAESLTSENNGVYIEPWGCVAPLRKDVEQSCKSKEEEGTGVAASFWDWSEEQVKQYR